MLLADRLRGYLDARRIPYSITCHPNAIRASELAHKEHLPAWEIAKTVVVYADKRYLMIVVPGDRYVDLHELQAALDLKHVRLASEAELAEIFPDCEVGAMPAIGFLHHLPVFLDSELARESVLTFHAGTHYECIHMRTADFRKIARPEILSLTKLEAAGHAW